MLVQAWVCIICKLETIANSKLCTTLPTTVMIIIVILSSDAFCFVTLSAKLIRLKVTKYLKQLRLHCPKNEQNIRQMKLGLNFVRYFVCFLGNGVSRKNAFEIYWPLGFVCRMYNANLGKQCKLVWKLKCYSKIRIINVRNIFHKKNNLKNLTNSEVTASSIGNFFWTCEQIATIDVQKKLPSRGRKLRICKVFDIIFKSKLWCPQSFQKMNEITFLKRGDAQNRDFSFLFRENWGHHKLLLRFNIIFKVIKYDIKSRREFYSWKFLYFPENDVTIFMTSP